MGKPINPIIYCMQEFTVEDMIEYGCNYSDCKHCGHNRNVWRYRRQQIEKNGLTKCDDGLYRFLIIKRSRGNGGKKA